MSSDRRIFPLRCLLVRITLLQRLFMKSLLPYSLVILAMIVALPALADDQQKAEKQVNKVTAMSTDATGRRVVSMTASDLLNTKRPDVVQERHETGLNYG